MPLNSCSMQCKHLIIYKLHVYIRNGGLAKWVFAILIERPKISPFKLHHSTILCSFAPSQWINITWNYLGRFATFSAGLMQINRSKPAPCCQWLKHNDNKQSMCIEIAHKPLKYASSHQLFTIIPRESRAAMTSTDSVRDRHTENITTNNIFCLFCVQNWEWK